MAYAAVSRDGRGEDGVAARGVRLEIAAQDWNHLRVGLDSQDVVGAEIPGEVNGVVADAGTDVNEDAAAGDGKVDVL